MHYSTRFAVSFAALMLAAGMSIPSALALSVSVGDINSQSDVDDLREDVQDELDNELNDIEDDCRSNSYLDLNAIENDLEDDIENIYRRAKDKASSSLDDDLDDDEDELMQDLMDGIDDLEDSCYGYSGHGYGQGYSPFGGFGYIPFAPFTFPSYSIQPFAAPRGYVQPYCSGSFGWGYPMGGHSYGNNCGFGGYGSYSMWGY